VQAKADSDHWRRKYFDAIRSLEQEERVFRELEGFLRRLVNRLCFAAMGLSPQLDKEVGRLTDAMRRKSDLPELESLFMPLSDAIAALDQAAKPAPTDSQVITAAAKASPTSTVPVTSATAVAAAAAHALPEPPQAAPPGEEIFGDDRVRQVLTRLLREIRRDARLAGQVESLEQRLQVSLTREQLPVVLAEIADLAAQRVTTVEEEKREVEALLAQITGRLDELSKYMLGEGVDRQDALDCTLQFNTVLVREMNEIGVTVDQANDVSTLKMKVRTRLDSISAHIEEFRTREESRARANQERSEQMRQRVESLESEARSLHDRLRDEQRLAMLDGLTQVPNRMAYDLRLVEEYKRFQRFNQATVIIAWDIDHFKKINDAYGHRAGDKVLRIVADCLASRIRGTDFLARYGGEEFVMILTGTSPQDALRVAEGIREAVAQLGFHFRGAPVGISLSGGLSAFREGDTPEDVFDRADKALYKAKGDGRNRCYLA
jgi:diguanylate cyclase